MKFAIGALALLLAFNVFAGPEEHLAQQSCYGRETNVPSHLASLIPEEICLERVLVDPTTQEIRIESYLTPSLFKGLKITEMARKNEDWFLFKAAGYLMNEMNSDCNDGQSVALHLAGRVDNGGEGQPFELAITVVHQTTNDTCHSKTQETVYNYRLK